MITLNKNKILWHSVSLFFSIIILNQVSAENGKRLVDKGNFLLLGMIDVKNYYYPQITFWGDTSKINIFTIEGTVSFLGFISKVFGIGADFHIRHTDETEFAWGALSFTQIGIGPKVSYFFDIRKIYPFLSLGTNYLNYTIGRTVGDGFRLKFSGGICAPFSGNAVFFIETGYFYDKLFYSPTSFSESGLYLGLGIGGFIIPNRK